MGKVYSSPRSTFENIRHNFFCQLTNLPLNEQSSYQHTGSYTGSCIVQHVYFPLWKQNGCVRTQKVKSCGQRNEECARQWLCNCGWLADQCTSVQFFLFDFINYSTKLHVIIIHLASSPGSNFAYLKDCLKKRSKKLECKLSMTEQKYWDWN